MYFEKTPQQSITAVVVRIVTASGLQNSACTAPAMLSAAVQRKPYSFIVSVSKGNAMFSVCRNEKIIARI